MVQRVRQRMADNIKLLPDYTCLETIERSVHAAGKKNLLVRDRIHLEVAYIGGNEMFAWPGSEHFDMDLFEELPPQGGAIATGGFGGWIGNLFGPSAPAFTSAGECRVGGRSGSRFTFRVPLSSSTHMFKVRDREINSAYTGSICVDPAALDVMTLEIQDEEIPAPLAASSEAIRYGRTRVGLGDFLLPQHDTLTVTDLEGEEFRNVTHYTACRQYTSHSSVSFDSEYEAAPIPKEKTEVSELPGGISLDLNLGTPITFEASAVGDRIVARLSRPVHASGVSIPKGATVSGRIRGLEQYYEPTEGFVVSLEFSSATFDGKRITFQARLVGPRFEKHVLPGSGPPGGLSEDERHIETTGFDIDKSAPRFGVFRVPGDSLHLGRGLRMFWETLGVGAVTELGETSERPAAGTNLAAVGPPPVVAAPPPAARQEPAVSATPQNQPAVAAREEHATFTSRVNLVMVPVVVRDKQGNVVDGLTKESFRLFDKGKLQEIDRFTVERPGSAQAQAAKQQRTSGEAVRAAATPVATPQRFIGYLFDDIHLEVADLINVRAAAERHIETQLQPADRAAILTTSGRGNLDFTDDREQIRNGLARLAPHPIARSIGQQCPDISYYQADFILNKDDAQALDAAIAEVIACLHPKDPAVLAKMEARRVLIAGQQETQVALATLKDAVRRMSTTTGERVLVLVSPGFLSLAEQQPDEYDVIERALRANVVINVLNAKGLYTTNIDASRMVIDAASPITMPPAVVEQVKQNLTLQSQALQEALLTEIAADTGGVYFHNNNDLDEGFRRTATAPELYYLLGFQPQDLKLDGSFHGLKVAIESKGGYSIEARRGYYAPTHIEDAAAAAKREIEDAIYSRSETSDLPVTMDTQFSKGSGGMATVTVLVHLDLANVKFRKADGRSLDHITLASALFDHNGNLVTGQVKHVDLHPRDESPAKGITVPMSLEAKSGSYFVRLVVGDSEGELMSAINATVDIP
ncbi:MAG TPA: VWA domain-containing protein [Bryobacteraceae bacterium]